MNSMLPILILSILPVALSFAAAYDFLTMRIPNIISIILFGSFLILSPFSGLTLHEIGFSYLAGLLVLIACFFLFIIGAMGGGDAKLLSTSALWFGFNQSLIEYLVMTSVIGFIVTIFFVFIRAQHIALARMKLKLPRALAESKKIPYGIAISTAGLLTYPISPIAILAFNYSFK